MLDPSDTIVAVSSPAGPASRGIVRLSGPVALALALDGFEGEGATPTLTRATSYRGRFRLTAPPALLPATVVLWPGPRSYTGGPVAEIHTVGSPPVLEHLVSRCLAQGARPAEPGEFTLRAFLAGRIDLAQSEAVLRVIEARSSAQLDAALRQLAGGLAGPAREVRDRLLDRLVELEANLDFVDESDIPPVVREGLVRDLADSARRLDDLLARLRERGRADARPLVVLAGAPNAGKSRLYNALLGHDRAIVSPVAGTTRDDLSATLDCEGIVVELADTAGEEESSSPIEASAQARRAARLTEADLVLLCTPAPEAAGGMVTSSWPCHPGTAPTWPRPRGHATPDASAENTLTVVSKADLSPDLVVVGAIRTSSATGEGLDALRSAIAARLREAASAEATAVGPEAAESMGRAIGSVGRALGLAEEGGAEELIAVELHQAVDDLGKIVGAVVSEDILDRIFRRFCVGK